MPFTSKRKRKKQPSEDDTRDWNNLNALPADNRRPARTIISSAPHRIVGGFDLPNRTPYPLEWESYLERVCYATLAMSLDVEWMASQPVELKFHLSGVPHRYFPDLVIRGPFGECFVEVKPLAILVSDENLERYVEVARLLRAAGKKIAFLTDSQILVSRRENNVLFIRRYLSGALTVDTIAAVHANLKDEPLPIDVLMRRASIDLREVYTMVAQRHLHLDWDRVIGLSTLVSLAGSGEQEMTFERIATSGGFSDLLAQIALGHRPTGQRQLALAKAYGQPIRKPPGLSIVGDFPEEKRKRRVYEPVDVFREPSAQGPGRSGVRAAHSRPSRKGQK